MTELEKKIYEWAKPEIYQKIDYIKNNKFESKFVEFVFWCDGCFDRLRYDIEKDEFSIQYQKGVGDAVYSIGNGFSAYFDKVEWLEFKIPDKVFVI